MDHANDLIKPIFTFLPRPSPIMATLSGSVMNLKLFNPQTPKKRWTSYNAPAWETWTFRRIRGIWVLPVGTLRNVVRVVPFCCVIHVYCGLRIGFLLFVSANRSPAAGRKHVEKFQPCRLVGRPTWYHKRMRTSCFCWFCNCLPSQQSLQTFQMLDGYFLLFEDSSLIHLDPTLPDGWYHGSHPKPPGENTHHDEPLRLWYRDTVIPRTWPLYSRHSQNHPSSNEFCWTPSKAACWSTSPLESCESFERWNWKACLARLGKYGVKDHIRRYQKCYPESALKYSPFSLPVSNSIEVSPAYWSLFPSSL